MSEDIDVFFPSIILLAISVAAGHAANNLYSPILFVISAIGIPLGIVLLGLSLADKHKKNGETNE